MNHYTGHFFVYACSLEHQTDGDEIDVNVDERCISGIDTRGAAASYYFKSTASGSGDAGNTVTVFAECTSSLRIMANKVLEIVQ